MIGLAPLRRFVVFAAIFSGGLGLLVWHAGGLAGQKAERVHGSVTGRDTGPLIDIEGAGKMGRGGGVRLERDAVAVVNGVPYEYRAFDASWATQEPRKGGAPGQRRLHVTECAMLLFHERPTAEQPHPPAIEGPGTTHVRADVADVTMREGAEFLADLAGNVVVTRHDTRGDLVLLSDTLDCDAEQSRVRTHDPVHLTGRGTSIRGTGLDADLEEPRATITSNVRGEFVARRGSLTTEGSAPTTEKTTTVVTCDGVAELRAISKPTRRAGRRWLATFHDNVVVSDGSTKLTCNTLDVEFRMAEGERRESDDGKDSVEVLRVVANGNVRMDASRDDDLFIVEAKRAISTREPNGAELIVLEGGTRMDFTGRIRARSESEEERGHIEIQCSGPASIHYEPPAAPGDDAPVRARAVFEGDVVARQWAPGDEETLETEIRAPLLTLFGTRGAFGKLEPRAMTAHGNDAQRVDIRRLGLAASARVVSWEVVDDLGVERVTLTKDPVASFEDRSGLNPLGSGSRSADATFVVTAKEEIVVVYPRRKDADGNVIAGQAGSTANANGNVVARRMIGDDEVYRLRADRADVEFAPDRKPRQLHAYGGVVLSGRGEREGERSAVLRGTRLRANAAGAGGVDDPWTEATVLVFGDPQAPAVAIVEELPDSRGVRRSHSIRAQELSYGESGTVVVARRAAEAALNSSADPGSGIDATDPFSGPLHIRADLLRAELFPARRTVNDARRPNLRRVTASGGVTVEGATRRVSGDRAVYDHVTGVAIVNGQPARASYRNAGEHLTLTAPTSTVTSPTIRAEFDVGADRDGKLKGVSCAGGRIVSYLYPSTQAGGRVPPLERVTVTATGPISVNDRVATASENVGVLYESQVPGGGWARDAHLTCDTATLGFDPSARGDLRDRVVRAYATGTSGRPVRLVTPRFEAVAEVVEGLGDWLHLRSTPPKRVHVTERDPIRELFFDSGSWNIRTNTWDKIIRPVHR